MIRAKLDDVVKVHYTGKFEDGEVFDKSADDSPFEFKIGEGQVIFGFEEGILGMQVNDKKTIEVEAADAYGEVKKELIMNLPIDRIPAGIDPKPGLKLISKAKDGSDISLIVTSLNDDSVTVDANHPLAGEDLTFDIH